jgi:hypothetical protein
MKHILRQGNGQEISGEPDTLKKICDHKWSRSRIIQIISTSKISTRVKSKTRGTKEVPG